MPRSGLVLAALLACTPEPAPPAPTPAQPVSELDRVFVTDWAPGQLPLVARSPVNELERETRAGKFLYTAEVELAGAPERGLPGPPQQLVAKLHATNTGRRPADLPVRGCNALHVLAYPRGDRSRGPAWDSDIACGGLPTSVTVAAKATHTLEATYPARDVLRATGQGRHEFVVSLPGSRDGSVEAGALTYDAGLADLRYQTTTRVEAGAALAIDVAIRNDGARPVQLLLSSCGPQLRAYPNGARAGPAAYRSDDLPLECPDIRVATEVAPGATVRPGDTLRELGLRVPVGVVLGGVVDSARYYFTLQLELNYVPVQLIAGEAVLVRPPPDRLTPGSA